MAGRFKIHVDIQARPGWMLPPADKIAARQIELHIAMLGKKLQREVADLIESHLFDEPNALLIDDPNDTR